MAKTDLTAQQLRELLSYDPKTGLFLWRVSRGKGYAGAIAGKYDKNGYIVIGANRQEFKSHQVAWMFVHGYWPTLHIDHIDGDKTNNRIANLRHVTVLVNQRNRTRPNCTNKLGILGVSKYGNKFCSRIWHDGGLIHLGTFNDVGAAQAAYFEAKSRLHVNVS